MSNPSYAPAGPRRGFRLSTRDVVVSGMIGAVAVVLGYVPWLGFIPAPTPAGAATTMHIPVIIAAALEGPVVGAMVGGIFGAFSFLRAAGNPLFTNPIIAFVPRILIGVLAYYAFVALRGRGGRWAASAILGGAIYTILGPGASQFEAAYAAAKIAPSWLVDGYHAVASATAPEPAVALAGGLAGAAIAFWLLRGENTAPAAAAVVGTLTNTVGVLALAVLFRFLPAGAAFVIGATHGLPEVILATVITVPVYRAVSQSRGRS